MLALALLAGCPDTIDAPDGGRRIPADLGDISGRGCAGETMDLRTVDGIDSVRPFCALATLDCVHGCAGDPPCEEACVEADETAGGTLPGTDSSSCAGCYFIQRNACLTAACPDVVAQLTCCIEDHPECGTDRGCSACGDRWDALVACRNGADCRDFQEWCFVEP